MPRKKNKARYTTAEQILAAIDHAKARAREKNIQADRCEIFAEEIFRLEDGPKKNAMIEEAKFRKARALSLRESARRLIEIELRKLGDKLSEFRTGLLTGVGFTDQSVPRHLGPLRK